MSSGLTVAAGTDGFRPPEQSRPAVVDIRADIWAMSAVLRWLIQDADLPAALHRTLERGMQEDSAARQADAAAWLTEVEEALTPAPAPPVPSAASGSSTGDSLSTPAGSSVPSGPSASRSETAAPPAGNRLRRRAVLGALLVLALVAGLGLGSLLDLRGAVPSAAGGASLAIDGPAEVRVGEEAVFTAEVEGVESWVWSSPTGSQLVDAEQMVLTASGSGTAEVVLRARAPGGQELEARRTVRVLE